MLIKNLDVKRGLCNGTRMQVMRLTDHNVFCRILTGPRADPKKLYLIPLVKFEYGTSKYHRGLKFRRLQYPLRLCFAMTVNKVFFRKISHIIFSGTRPNIEKNGSCIARKSMLFARSSLCCHVKSQEYGRNPCFIAKDLHWR